MSSAIEPAHGDLRGLYLTAEACVVNETALSYECEAAVVQLDQTTFEPKVVVESAIEEVKMTQ